MLLASNEPRSVLGDCYHGHVLHNLNRKRSGGVLFISAR